MSSKPITSLADFDRRYFPGIIEPGVIRCPHCGAAPQDGGER